MSLLSKRTIMQLSKTSLPHINPDVVQKPAEELLALPEKVLQFGTGVLLRGLPDYFIDKANRKNIFSGRIVVVKSTEGEAQAFDEQDGLYTLCIRGVEGGNNIEENRICAAISRVLSAKQQWDSVLQCATNADLQVIISNTTEVGIQLTKESIFQNPPASFPAKLLAFLYERFKKFGTTEAARMIVLPTELITENGKKLQAIVTELAAFNKLETAFVNWLDTHVQFCNTLVDCIVPGRPERAIQERLEKQLGYTDALLIISEVYRLWAIEGDEALKTRLSFATADDRIIITPDITKYKELKLRLLNGTHTLSCGLACLAGIETVKEAMGNDAFAAFISNLMLNELARAIPYPIPGSEVLRFGQQVLDRFRNPHVQHKWLNITLQYSSKMAQRIIPVLLRYVELYKTIPQHLALGFAAYLLFMKSVKQAGKQFWGEHNGQLYLINDEHAGYYFELWQQHSAEEVVHKALQNEGLWGVDLSRVPNFEAAVLENLHNLQTVGVLQTITLLQTR